MRQDALKKRLAWAVLLAIYACGAALAWRECAKDKRCEKAGGMMINRGWMCIERASMKELHP